MDVEQFIELIKERPCLYDLKHVSYKNKREKEKKWKEIAAAMEMTSELAKCKWKNLKDNYSKHLKGTTATSGHYLKYLHWTWAPNMEFMKKYINCTSAISQRPSVRWTHENSLINEDDEIEQGSPVYQSSLKSDGRSEEMSLDNKTELHTQVSRHRELSPRKIYQYMDSGEIDGYDATDLIFLGYAKAVKALSIRRQAEIKLKIAQIITDEEVAHYEEKSAYLDSPYYPHSPSPQNDPLHSRLTHAIQIKTEKG